MFVLLNPVITVTIWTLDEQVSDYEDIWGPDSLSSFKPVRSPFSSPEEGRAPVPDILERVSTSIPPAAPVPRNRLGLSVNTTPVSPNPVAELKTPVDSQPSVSLQRLLEIVDIYIRWCGS